MIAIILAATILVASYIFVVQSPYSEKTSAYECGFETYENSRHLLDVRFFLIAILFIIFDIEVVLLIPWCINLAKGDPLSFWIIADFVLELGIGLFYIWNLSAIDW